VLALLAVWAVGSSSSSSLSLPPRRCGHGFSWTTLRVLFSPWLNTLVNPL
jgi:hypothetical protein